MTTQERIQARQDAVQRKKDPRSRNGSVWIAGKRVTRDAPRRLRCRTDLVTRGETQRYLCPPRSPSASMPHHVEHPCRRPRDGIQGPQGRWCPLR